MTSKSPYTYPYTDVLINKANIQDQKKLNEFERLWTTKRLAELYERPITGQFDLRHMQKIHHYIFQDVYPWAGKVRTVDIAKGNTFFCRTINIDPEANKIFAALKDETYLKGKNLDEFVDRLSYYTAEINVLHPFREGNGRTTREFVRCLGLNAGFEVDWSRLPKEKVMNAMIESVLDTKELKKVLQSLVVNKEPDKKYIRLLEHSKEINYFRGYER